MKSLLWDKFEHQDQQQYLKRIQMLGMLSGLFKELDGMHGSKPYLHYRNHEILYTNTFQVMSIARADSAFDAIARVGDKTFGVGLKTWMYHTDQSNQKIAEFNRKSKELRALFDANQYEELIDNLALLRNERIKDDKRRYLTDKEIYHIIVRDYRCFHVVETDYPIINRDNITQINKKDSSVSFFDGENHYSFNMSKTTLFKKFDVSEKERIITFPVNIIDNPIILLDELYLSIMSEDKCDAYEDNRDYILLPLYNDRTLDVNDKSVFNASLAKSKKKGSDTPRPQYEAYAPIPKYIHHLFPRFFGIDALNRDEREKHRIKLHLPNNQCIDAKITQDNGKGLQTSPQSILGRWLLFDLFGLKPYEPLTRELIDAKEIDCIKINKIDDHNFSVDAGSYGEYEQWKYRYKKEIEALKEKGEISILPKFRVHNEESNND